MKENRKQNAKKQEARTRNRLPPPDVKGLGMFSPEIDTLERPAAPNEWVRVPIDQVDVPEHVQRRPLNVGKVRDIAVTLRAGGSVNAITLLPKEGGRFEVETGRHRFEAHRLAGFRDVPATIQRDTDPARVAFRRTVENHMRRSISPYEEALDYQDMVDAKWTLDDLCRSLNVPAATIKARLRLLALPMDVGMRIGEAGFPLGHAELLLPLCEHPKLLEAATKAIGALDFDKRPLTVHGFREAVLKELRGARLVKDLGTWQVRELGQKYPDFRRRVAKLPRVKLGSGHGSGDLCVDPKAYRQLVAPFQAKLKEEREKQAAKEARARARRGEPPEQEDWQERNRRQQYLRAYVGHEHAQRIAKAAKACLGVHDQLLGLMALDALADLAQSADVEREGVLLAQAVGMAPTEMADLLAVDNEQAVENRRRFIDRLLENPDRLALARFLTVATLLRLEGRGGDEWLVVGREWLGVDYGDLEARALKAYHAWVDAGATEPIPGEAHDDGVEAEARAVEAPPGEVAGQAEAELA